MIKPPRSRFLAPILLLSIAAAVFYATCLDHSGGVTFPLTPGAASWRSPPFRAEKKLYLVRVETDRIGDFHRSACLLVGNDDFLTDKPCSEPRAVTFDWKLYADGKLVAVNGPDYRLGVDDWLGGAGDGRVDFELGSFELARGYEYELEVAAAQSPPVLKNATVRVGLHPWKVKDSLGGMLLGFLATIALCIGALVWALRLAFARWREA